MIYDEKSKTFKTSTQEQNEEFEKTFGFFKMAWIVSAILGLGVLGIMVWALIELITWITTK